ncbi:MAG: hypothetical protein ACREDS_11280 [Limisphaerales bacterium]
MNKFVSIVKIAAAGFPSTAVLSQWLSEIEAAKTDERIRILENPLSKYGQKAPELCRLIYKKIQDLDYLTNQIKWSVDFEPYKKDLRHFEADSLLKGSHTIGSDGEFRMGFRLIKPQFVIYLAMLNGNSGACEKLVEQIESSITPLNGAKLKDELEIPLFVIDSFFAHYEAIGQGLKSKTIGESIYLPKN